MGYPVFAAGDVLNASDMNAVGLWLVKTQTLNAASNNITSCFSSLYDNYRVVISGFESTGATQRSIIVKMLSGTTANSTNYSWMLNYAYGASLGGNVAIQGTTGIEVGLSSTRAGQSIVMEFYRPNDATPTALSFQTMLYQSDITSYIIRTGGAAHNVSTAYDGFQIAGTTDSLTGTVRVYGYRD